MRKRTWKVLDADFVGDGGEVELICRCGYDAIVPTRGRGPMVIATIGMGLVLDPPWSPPPPDWMPETLQCRRCRRIYRTDRKPRAGGWRGSAKSEAR